MVKTKLGTIEEDEAEIMHGTISPRDVLEKLDEEETKVPKDAVRSVIPSLNLN